MRTKAFFISSIATALLCCVFPIPLNAAKASSLPATCHFNTSQPYEADRCIAETAATFYEYAILAILAYKRDANEVTIAKPRISDGLELPAGFVERPELNCKTTECERAPGYQYKIYDRLESGTPTERIIAFRGSDEPVDWLGTNFGLGKRAKLQRRAAMATYRRIAADTALPISVVGDSLGGALAAQVALCYPTYRRVILDSSPRFKARDCTDGKRRTEDPDTILRNQLFYERGEALQYVRHVTNRPTQLETKLNCISGWNPIKQHDGARLAACILRRASNLSATGSPTLYYTRNKAILDELLAKTERLSLVASATPTSSLLQQGK